MGCLSQHRVPVKQIPKSKMATSSPTLSLVPRQLTLANEKGLPPSVPLIISSKDHWNPATCQLETAEKPDPNSHSLQLVEDGLELLRSIDKPLAVLSICGPYRSGKSYFISRVLGSPGAFRLGHSMQACTKGIWMATSVLECDEFATVLLDTEGIDAVGASETVAMSLLTLTTLLSSFLIYNSKKVPQKVHLDKMRCFSQLSTSLLAQCGKALSREAQKEFFPRFLWLLRDVSLKMTDRGGKEVGPTEFLHSRLLAAESGELTKLGKSLVNLFPSLECATLPIPSTKGNIICNILEHEENLKPAFNAAVDTLIQRILQQVSPKRAIDGTSAVNGKALAALAGVYVEAVNRPGALPDLDQGWQAVVRLQLKEASYKLVREYEREMEEALEGNLPMKERNLLRVHQQTLNRMKSVFREEICCINPLHSSEEEAQPLLDQLEQDIVQWDEPSRDGERKVTGGVLYRFTAENFTSSKKHCERVLIDLMKESKVQQKVLEAVKESLPVDIQKEVSEITKHYFSRAVGPAASDVLQRGLAEVGQLSEILKKIPGRPRNVRVVGTGADRVKLSWEPPQHNPEAVEEYVVYKRVKGGEWEEAVRTEETHALVKGLKSESFGGISTDSDPIEVDPIKTYDFQVIAVNSTMMSLENAVSFETGPSNAALTGLGVATAALFLPYVIGNTQEALKENTDFGGVAMSRSKEGSW